MIEIGIVEDHTLMRDELVRLLEDDPQFQVTFATNNFTNALTAAEQHRCDVLLLDLQLPDGNGIDLIRHFRAYNPNLKVVVLTVHHDESHALQAMEHGVDAYVLKDDEHIRDHIIAAHQGQHPVDRRVTGHLMSRLVADQPIISGDLTPRELQTLAGLHRGLSYAQIADTMNISINTVPGYIKNLYRKLGVTSRSQAVYRAGKLGLLG